MKGKLFCPCNCGLIFKAAFRNVLETLEREVGFELKITSGPRCEKYNATVTQNKNSAHVRGEAADIEVENSRQRWQLVRAIYLKGIKRVGRSDKRAFLHMDIATGPLPFPTENLKEYPQQVDWTYE